MKTVSVIIPVFNAGLFLEETLTSVLTQTYTDLDIIAVDDGSSDNSAGIVVRLGKRDSRVRLFSMPQNQGIARARNRAMEEVRGDYIAFLDSDDLWDPEKIKKQVALLDRHPAAGLIFTASRVVDKDGNILNENLCAGREIPTGRIDPLTFIIDRYPLITSSVMIRGECVRDLGMFDSRFETGEDFEYWLRILRRFDQIFIPEVLTSYRDHAQSASKNRLCNRRSKVAILEHLRDSDPDYFASLGPRMALFLFRQKLGLAQLLKQNSYPEMAEREFKSAQLLNVPRRVKLKAKLLKRRYC